MAQQPPRSSAEYAAAQQLEIGAALAAVQRLWARMGTDFDPSYAAIEGPLLAVLDTAQRRVVAGATAYIPRVLAETNPAALNRAPLYRLADDAIVGTAGDGLSTNTLAYESVIYAKSAIKGGAQPVEALERAGGWLSRSVGTMLSDTGRTAEVVTSHAHHTTTFVRMLNPPSCGRCVILAGTVWHTGTAFLRHPKCDCRNIPSAESVAGDLTVNPHDYLGSLDAKGLSRTLGSEANAKAYSDGADLNQLINAYRRGGDVRAAQVYGRTVKYTTEGTTRHGIANWRMHQAAALKAGGRALQTPRLMPESIYQLATDQADATRLLKLYGWIL